MADEYVLNPHLSSELPVGACRSLQSANAVVCLSKRGVVNECAATARQRPLSACNPEYKTAVEKAADGLGSGGTTPGLRCNLGVLAGERPPGWIAK